MSEGVMIGRPVTAVEGVVLTPGMAYAEAHRTLKAVEDVQVDDAIERLLAPAKLRRGYIQTYGFSIITAEELEVLVGMLSGKRVLEVGAGSGYISRLLSERGVDMTASESGGWSKYGQAGAVAYQRDHEGNSLELVGTGFDAVLMAWPPLGDPFAAEVARRMGAGQTLIHLGEGAGGCTGDHDFSNEIRAESRWAAEETLSDQLNQRHLRFDGMRDHWQVMRRI